MTTSLPKVHGRESNTRGGGWSGTQSDHRWIALAALCLSVVIVNVDNTILNVALPTLVRTLHATSSQLQWIVDSYAMAFAGLLLVGGSLGDRFGRKRLFVLGLTLFVAGSLGAAFSDSVPLLIAFRAVMGAGAALTMPSTLSIINDTFRVPRERSPRHQRMGGFERAGHRHWPGRRRAPALQVLVGLGVPGQRPDRGRRGGRCPAAGKGLKERRRGPAGSGWLGAVDRGPGAAAVGDHRGADRRLGLAAS